MLLSQEGKFSYQEWKSQQLPGKVRTVQHIAGRSSAKELNAPLIEAIKKRIFPMMLIKQPQLSMRMMPFLAQVFSSVTVLKTAKRVSLFAIYR